MEKMTCWAASLVVAVSRYTLKVFITTFKVSHFLLKPLKALPAAVVIVQLLRRSFQ